MACPALVCFDVPEHDCGRGAQTDAVRRPHHTYPFARRHLVWTDDRTHFVVKDFGGCARQCRKTCFLELCQIVIERHPQRGRRSEEHTSELQSLMRISYAVFCLKKKKHNKSTR